MGILINKKTGKEVEASDPDKVLERFPKQYRKKPATELNNEVAKAEKTVLSKTNEDIEADIAKSTDIVELEKMLKAEKAGKNRKGATASLESRISELKEQINNTEVKADKA